MTALLDCEELELEEEDELVSGSMYSSSSDDGVVSSVSPGISSIAVFFGVQAAKERTSKERKRVEANFM